jgi:hypothetical protein
MRRNTRWARPGAFTFAWKSVMGTEIGDWIFPKRQASRALDFGRKANYAPCGEKRGAA